jgi:phosphopantetheinyl transferase
MRKLSKVSTAIIKVLLEQDFKRDLSSILPEQFLSWGEKKKATYIAGRSALYSLVEKFYGKVYKDPLLIAPYGKPYFADDFFKFSITHSSSVLYLMISPHDVGIDVEEIKPRKNYDEIKERIFNSDEKYFLSQEPENELRKFYWLWTIKETLVKTTGRGLVGFHELKMQPSINLVNHKDLNGHCYTYDLGKHVMSFYIPNAVNVDDVTFWEYDGKLDEFFTRDELCSYNFVDVLP